MARWPDLGTRYIQETITPGEGVNLVRPAIQIRAGEASEMYDFSSRMYPSLKTRDGRVQRFAAMDYAWPETIFFSQSGQTHVLAQNRVSGFTDWLYWNATTQKWVVIDAGIESYGYTSPTGLCDWYNITAGATFTSANTWYTFCIRKGAGGLWKIMFWNGSAVSEIAEATYPCVNGPIAAHMNRLFTTPSSTSGQLGWSTIRDPSTWTSPGGGIIPVGSGERILDLISMRDRLFIKTQRGAYALFGQDEDNFTLSPIVSGLTTPANTSGLACAANDVVFFSDGYDIYEYTGDMVRNITRENPGSGISGGFTETYNTNTPTSPYLRISSMASDGKRLYCIAHLTYNSVGTYLWVFDILQRKWYVENFSTTGYPYARMNKTVDGRIGCMYAELTAFAAEHVSPKLLIFNGDQNYDNYVQYNLVDDGDMSDIASWTAIGGTDSIAGGYYQSAGNGSSATVGTYQTTGQRPIDGHKVYISVYAKVTNASAQSLSLIISGSTGGTTTVDTQAAPVNGTWYKLSGIATLDATFTGYLQAKAYATYADAATANGKNTQLHSMWMDDISLTYGLTIEPTEAQYEADMQITPFTSKLQSTTNFIRRPEFTYISPAFQLRPTAKKALANITITADLTDAATFEVLTSSDMSYPAFTAVYTMGTAPTKESVVRIKIPVSAAQSKAEFIRVKIYGTGQATIMNITLDWRVVERAR